MDTTAEPATVTQLPHDYLDIFGQQPGLNIYTQICLCYELSVDASRSAIITTLTTGLVRLSKSFPWVACKVVGKPESEGGASVFKFQPLENIPKLVVKDYTNDATITMAALRQVNFPASKLHESVICPINTLPGGPGDYEQDARVLLLQATFVAGGLLLTVNAQHNVMDMTGQGEIMRLLSKACRDEPFTNEEVRIGNLDRKNIIPLLDDSWQPGPEFDHYRASQQVDAPAASDAQAPVAPPPPPQSIWAFFTFSTSALSAIKSLTTSTLKSGYVSTDDALTAFIWQAVTRARLLRLHSSVQCKLGRAIDPRRFMGIPTTYTGFVQNMAYHSFAAKELDELPLGAIASNLREAVEPETTKLGYTTSALATMIHRSEDKNIISVTATMDLSKDIMLSSWVKEDCYELDFGLGLGKPEAVRRPSFVPVESLFYLMPKRSDGEIAAMLCLREEDMERLKEDPDFVKYGVYVG